jgi:tetratricopeptide (TPR) repeat protein
MINPQEMGRQLLSEVPSAAPPGVVSPTGFHSKRWVDEAEAKAASGDRAGAIQDLEQALVVEPNSLFVLRTLGSLLMEDGKFREAKQRFQQLLAQESDYLEGRVLSAIASLKLGRLDEFQVETDRVLAIDPHHADALRWRARVAFDNQLFAEAGQYYIRLVDSGKGDADVLTALGVCLAQGGQWHMAAETFARVQVGHGGAEVARENLGVARQRIGRRADAQDIAALLAEADADHQSGHPSLACWAWIEVLRVRPRDDSLRRTLVSVLLEQRWTQAARAHLEELFRSNPWDPSIGTWLALVLFESGDKTGATSALEGVFALDPGFEEARRLEADFALRDGRYEEGRWLIQRLLDRNPGDFSLLLSRGICAFHLGRWDEAVSGLEEAAKLKPDNAQLQRNLAVAREQQRAAAMAQVDSHVRAELDQAGELQARGEIREALGRLEALAALRPEWSEIWDSLGSLRYLSGDALGGARDLSHAIRLAPGLPDTQVRLAMAYRDCQRASEAMSVLDQVVVDHPEHGAAWRLKGDLELDSSPENARLSYAALLRSQPVLLDDLIRLAVAHLQTGRRVEARALFQAILAISPDHAVALKGLERAQAA